MSKSEIELVSRIAKAQLVLEGAIREHRESCPVNDPHMAGMCTCGADEQNTKIQKALSFLQI
jgi:hypothetical protein